MNEVVDLGLPSGTLWCKYNLGVDQNQLSKTEDWYGDYYAWGELKPNKLEYDWEHYKFGQNNSNSKITKYNKNDNLIQLLPEDDVAYQNKKLHNFKFHMPTKEQCRELLNYIKNYYWVNNYDPNKVIHNSKNDSGIQKLNGIVFEGKNGNQMFVPAAGFYNGSEIYYVSSGCYLFSSSLYLENPLNAYRLNFDSIGFTMLNDHYRYCGLSIRPVINL